MKFPLQINEVFFAIHLKFQGIDSPSLIFAAFEVLPVHVFKGKHSESIIIGAHRPHVVVVVLIVVVHVAIVHVHVPGVVWIVRILSTGPVVVGLQ
jgi:hypothetical protein